MQPRTIGQYTLAVELLRECVAESAIVFDEMWSEVCGGKTSPDWGRWIILERQGELLNITVRDADREMVGYARVYLRKSITTGKHYAEEDMVFISEKHRGGDLVDALREFTEEACAEAGFHDLHITTPLHSKVHHYMTRHGYEAHRIQLRKTV